MNSVFSPCVKICKIAPDTNQCVGCFRTLQEITEWSVLTDIERLDIMVKLKERGDEKTKETANSICAVHERHSVQTKSGEVS